MHDNEWDKKYDVCDKYIQIIETESAATSAVDTQNRMVKEMDHLSAPCNDPEHQSNLLPHKKQMEAYNVDMDCLMYKGLNKESKVVKQFRASVIEFLKELMKPIWHEGNITKDAYKIVVQKAEEKVLSRLHPNQIPSTPELVEQYLSSSHPKILKLIKGYVDQYGKS